MIGGGASTGMGEALEGATSSDRVGVVCGGGIADGAGAGAGAGVGGALASSGAWIW